MDLMYLILGIVIGFALAWFIKKSQPSNQNSDEVNLLRNQLQQATNESSGLKSSKDYLTNETIKLNNQIETNQNEILRINNELSSSKSDLKNNEEKLIEQKAELTNLREQFTKEFENLANRIFEEKSKKFTDQNKTNLDELLKPLGEKIKDFEKKVNDVYVSEGKERASLKEQLTMLHQLNQQMSTEAQNLTKALKGESNNKFQGNWGEIILENILEKSGLVKDREYLVQMSLTTEDGKRFQPDIVVNLPDGKHLVIDSKVSLNAYERFSSAESDDERQTALKEHLISVKKHIKDLSDKNYQTLYQLKTLDFVLLFIPIEPAFALSVQGDAQLFNDAFDKNIVIVSPSTMLATLRTVASIWRQENQNKNAIEIARQGGALYDKFSGFVEDLIALGNKMRDSQKTYEAAMNKLSTGSGNLVKRTEELKKLGAKATKNLPQSLLDRADEKLID
ncbi:MAG: DNA recombination protein RmuC [Bacteroidota bacterium]